MDGFDSGREGKYLGKEVATGPFSSSLRERMMKAEVLIVTKKPIRLSLLLTPTVTGVQSGYQFLKTRSLDIGGLIFAPTTRTPNCK